ncbi:hypothetical protein O9G_004801 [Rozella allomycis CSF55]|uniref:Uncharacterized protein n=1 Tax=Rozella allomycis (strain CSF55) TaxID=988480 RepID=A0A075AQF6_ROZAC|nr:hypothetical protein O9G_004801 [Rozella allomycis CSF55]|eukprot:EPZ32481.1 hypothetical protein O9G_004801 [Rozella allomycis CSF55]
MARIVPSYLPCLHFKRGKHGRHPLNVIIASLPFDHTANGPQCQCISKKFNGELDDWEKDVSSI